MYICMSIEENNILYIYIYIAQTEKQTIYDCERMCIDYTC